jgi:hypothetical protein
VGSRCQACRVGVPLIGTRVGNADDPFGVCVNCGSMTCGHHGYRTPKPRLLCIQCDVSLQAGSAGWNDWLINGPSSQSPTSSTQYDIADQLRSLLPDGLDSLIESFEQWAAQRPVYARLIELVLQDLNGMLMRLGEVRPGADWPVVQASVERDPELARQFADFWARIDDNGRRLLAAAFVMARVMNLPRWSLPPVLARIATVSSIDFRDGFPEPGHEIPFEENRYR